MAKKKGNEKTKPSGKNKLMFVIVLYYFINYKVHLRLEFNSTDFGSFVNSVTLLFLKGCIPVSTL
jgi:hypothetical protein